MKIYFILLLIWLILYLFQDFITKNLRLNGKLLSAIYMGGLLFLLMGLRSSSVGADTKHYLFLYNYHVYPLDLSIFSLPEWLFFVFTSILKFLSFSDQEYLMVYGFIVSASFTRFFYKYSTNIFLSMFLHVTFGLFAMSMSGMRQTLAICIVLFAFDFMVRNKLIPFVICVMAAFYCHNSAIVFLPVYFLRNLKITQARAVVLLCFVSSFVFLRTFIVPVTEFLSPEKYIRLYGAFSDLHPVNPLVILVAFSIPFVCLFFWDYTRWSSTHKTLMSIFFLMSVLNLFFNILSLNMNLIGRLSFYFIPFNMVLIPAIISDIKDELMKILGVVCCLVFPLLQFIISGGTLRIDRYLFFWQ
jgi:hypothetical protein